MTTQMKLHLAAAALFLIGLVSIGALACVRLYRMSGSALSAFGAGRSFSMHNSLGNTAYGRRDYSTAIQEYTAMVQERPEKMDGYFLRAMAEDKAHLYGAAIRDNTTVLALLKTPQPYYYATRSSGSHGLSSSRHGFFGSRPARSSHNDAAADTYYNRGLAYQAQGNLSLAIADFSAQLARLPDDYDGLESRMPAYYDNKQYAQALADSNTLLRTHPQDQWAYCFRGKSEMSLGNYAAAFQDLAAAVKIAPDYLTPYFVLAEMTDKTHQFLPTLALLQQGVVANPGNANLKGTQGWLQYEAGQLPAAIVTDKEALTEDGSMDWVLANLGLCYAVQEDAADARKTYTQVLAQNKPQERIAARKDIEDALRRHPGSVVLQQSLQQFTEAEPQRP